MSTLVLWRLLHPWVFLTGQTSLPERSCHKKKKGKWDGENRWHLMYTHIHVHTRAHTYTHYTWQGQVLSQ